MMGGEPTAAVRARRCAQGSEDPGGYLPAAAWRARVCDAAGGSVAGVTGYFCPLCCFFFRSFMRFIIAACSFMVSRSIARS